MIGVEGVKLTMFIRSQVNASSKKEGEDLFETARNIHTPALPLINQICLFALFNSVAEKTFVRKKRYWGGGNLFPPT